MKPRAYGNKNGFRHGHAGRDGKQSRTYASWRGMIQRCTNPTHKWWHNYGGAGISFDPRWKDFKNFLADMGERPLGMTIDRIDSAKDYNKGNCTWSTRQGQANNRRVSKLTDSDVLEIRALNDVTYAEIGRRYGISTKHARAIKIGASRP